MKIDKKQIKEYDKLKKLIVWIDLLLIIISNGLIYTIWYKAINAVVDTMFFGGLIILVLIIAAVYYLILLIWNVRLLKNILNPNIKIMQQSIILLIMIVVPILFYLLSVLYITT